MKKSYSKTLHIASILVCCELLFFEGAVRLAAAAAPLNQALVSQIIRDVRLLEAHAAPRPAAVNDKVTLGTAVRTGVDSRAELTFPDLTITRLGANTIFSFKQGARELNLTSGAVLLEVPPGGAPAKVSTAAVTAAITGGTALFAVGPPTKFMVLEGTGSLYPAGHPERAVTLHGGEMSMMSATGQITKPAKFDVKLVLQTSRLILDFSPLANLPLIMAVVNQQLAAQLAGTSQPLARNLVDVDVMDQNRNANPIVLISTSGASPTPPPITPTPSPSGTPTKFGTPSTITLPNPYLITSGTLITTDPSITTNGVTDYGKIYRGQSTDGLFSAWALGSTSAFDTASGFDGAITGSGAVFKFTALQLTGNPTIDVTNGQINLGLVAVAGITSGGPGGVLTFSGIRGLLLATQNGSITLGPEISFSGLHDLTLYARGPNGDLTLGSDISTTSQVQLFAERDLSLSSSITTESLYGYAGRNATIGGSAVVNAPTITLFAGQNMNWDNLISNETVSSSDGKVSISAGQALDVAGDLSIVRQNGGVSSGLNVVLSTGTDLSVGGDLSIATDVSNLTTGANIDVLADRNLTVGGSLALQTSASAQSGTGASIDLRVGGTLSAGDIFLGIELAVDAPQASGENLTLFTGQDLIAHNEANSGGITLEIITPIQQTVNSGANLLLSVGGNLLTDAGGDTTLFINNNINRVVNGANILSVIGGNLATNNLTVELLNNNGEIDTGGIVDFAVTGNITAQGAANFDIQNEGGIMGSNAAIYVAAANISANSLSAQIDNSNGGAINGDAAILMNVSGNITIANDATFQILGSSGATDSAILFNGGNYDVGGQFLGYLDGNGSITFNNTIAHADVLKAGVFGPNGVLNVGGGMLSADTTLKLYAPGSNGQLNFVSNVTLGGNSLKILAANSITIFDGVVVTIGGQTPAQVYTNNANYSAEWGGNGTTTGTFAGAGADRPLPLSEAPPFSDPPRSNVVSSKRNRTVINIRDSEQLLALLDETVRGPRGEIAVLRGHHRGRHWSQARQFNADRVMRTDRGMADIRHMRDHGMINSRAGNSARAF
jgi:hypothetical protein